MNLISQRSIVSAPFELNTDWTHMGGFWTSVPANSSIDTSSQLPSLAPGDLLVVAMRSALNGFTGSLTGFSTVWTSSSLSTSGTRDVRLQTRVWTSGSNSLLYITGSNGSQEVSVGHFRYRTGLATISINAYGAPGYYLSENTSVDETINTSAIVTDAIFIAVLNGATTFNPVSLEGVQLSTAFSEDILSSGRIDSGGPNRRLIISPATPHATTSDYSYAWSGTITKAT